MSRFGSLTLVSLLAASLVTLGTTPALGDDDHRKLHHKLEKRHEKYHRKHDGPPYGKAHGYYRNGPGQHGPGRGRDVPSGYGYEPGYHRYAAECGHIHERARKAREGLARWEGTGRHRKAVRAWHEVLANTPRKLDECQRNAARRAERRYSESRYPPDYYDYPPAYGTGYGDPYDPYASSSGFEWKRDWPVLLGGLLGAYGQ